MAGFSIDKAKELQKAEQFDELFQYCSAFPEDMVACCRLADCWRTGRGTEKDMLQAAYLYKKSADMGFPMAMYRIASLFENGSGVAQDINRAFEYYSMAASKGHRNATYKLGVCYAKGNGTPVDNVEAMKCFRNAADRGHPDAMFEVGADYLRGVYTDGLSEMEAIEYLKQAADKHHPGAMFMIGSFLYEGKCGMANRKGAVEWWQKAADCGDPSAAVMLGDLYESGEFVGKDEHRAVELYIKAVVASGDFKPIIAIAMFKLGVCKFFGRGTKQDFQGAMDWFQSAAELGYDPAMFQLGLLYLLTNNLPMNSAPDDKRNAEKWLRKAAECGNEDAKDFLLNHADALAADEISSEAYAAVKKELEDTKEKLDFEKEKVLFYQDRYEAQQLRIEKTLESIDTNLHTNIAVSKKTLANTEEINAKTDELLHVVTDCIPKLIQAARDELSANLKALGNDLQAQEERIAQWITETSDKINRQIDDDRNAADDVAAERVRLETFFGKDQWDKLRKAAQASLVSASVLLKRCEDITDTDFDFSGICISATSALEAEVKDVFFEGLQAYLEKKHGRPDLRTQSEAEIRSIWPEVLLYFSKTGQISLKRASTFTLGNLQNLFGLYPPKEFCGDWETQKTLLTSCMNEYLQTVFAVPAGKDPVTLFTDPDKSDQSFLDRCDDVRRRYRNRAAHVGSIPRKDADACYGEVVGKVAAGSDIAEVTGLLKWLTSHMK